MAFLATLAVALRFVARYVKNLSYGLDDYLVVSGLVGLFPVTALLHLLKLVPLQVLSLGICACNIVGGAVGRFGAHEIDKNGYLEPYLLIVYGKILALKSSVRLIKLTYC